jgi:hypothetical protein
LGFTSDFAGVTGGFLAQGFGPEQIAVAVVGFADLADRDGFGDGRVGIDSEAMCDAVAFHVFSFVIFSFSSFVLTMYGATKPVTGHTSGKKKLAERALREAGRGFARLEVARTNPTISLPIE